MNDWEDFAEDQPVSVMPAIVIKSSWGDEDEEVDNTVKESWEDEDEDEDVKPKSSTTGTNSTATKKKKPIAQAIVDRKAEEERTQKELLEKRAQMALDKSTGKEETTEQRRVRLKKEEEAANADNINDLFGSVSVDVHKALEEDEAVKIEDNPLVALQPKDKEQFDILSELLLYRFASFESEGLYTSFLESFIKSVCNRLKAEDIRKISSTLNTLYNEKQRAEKGQSKKKKSTKTKAQVRVTKGSDNDEENDYNEGL